MCHPTSSSLGRSRAGGIGMAAAALCTTVVAAAWSAQEVPGAVASAPADAPAQIVAATVDGQPILVADVARAVRSLLKSQPVEPGAQAALEAELLERLIDHQLARARLEALGLSASAAEIDRAMAGLGREMTAQKQSLDDALGPGLLSEQALRDQIAWKLSWRKYLDGHLTDELLQATFDAHRRDFDGTEVRASHILLQRQESGTGQGLASLGRQAENLRKQIVAGTIDFATAARKVSVAPSRKQGGDLGFFPRSGLMAESFAQAAFALHRGDISGPVATRFGVHLILLTDVKPGKKTWTDVRRQLAAQVERQLYRKLALEQRRQATITRTGAATHFKPGTRQLVRPSTGRGQDAKPEH